MNWRSPNSTPGLLIPLQSRPSDLLSLWERSGEGLRPQNSRLRCDIPRSHIGNSHAPKEFGTSSPPTFATPPFFRLCRCVRSIYSDTATKTSPSFCATTRLEKSHSSTKEPLLPVRSSTAPWSMILMSTILVNSLQPQFVVARSLAPHYSWWYPWRSRRPRRGLPCSANPLSLSLRPGG